MSQNRTKSHIPITKSVHSYGMEGNDWPTVTAHCTREKRFQLLPVVDNVTSTNITMTVNHRRAVGKNELVLFYVHHVYLSGIAANYVHYFYIIY